MLDRWISFPFALSSVEANDNLIKIISFFSTFAPRQVNILINRAVVQAIFAAELRKIWVSLDCQ